MADELETISPAEFDGWLTPRAAKQKLQDISPNYSTPIVEAINTRAIAGQLRVAAKTIHITPSATNQDRTYEIIPPNIWKKLDPNYTDDFWSTGQIEYS